MWAGQECVDVGRLVFQLEDSSTEAGQRHLGGVFDLIATLAWAHGGRLGNEIGGGETLETAPDHVGGGVAELTHLVHSAQAPFSRRALCHEQHPDGLHVAVAGLWSTRRASRQDTTGRLDGVSGVGLSLLTTHLAVGPVDLDDFDAGALEEPGQPRAVGPGAFDTNLLHRAKATHPLEQRLIPAWRGHEGLHTQHATDRVQGSGHVDVQMGVDTADHGAFGLYDGHCHPFLPNGQGVARPSREGVTVRIDLL